MKKNLTKAGPSSNKPYTMNRPRINALLEEAVQSSLVTISAPTGFGKTQAVASFLESTTQPAVWHQFTLLDNLPTRFWESLMQTVSLHYPKLAEKLKTLGFPASLYDFHRVLQTLNESLSENSSPILFIFDDFHIIDESSVIKFFEYLLAAKLENISFIFITRNPEINFAFEKPFTITLENLRFTKEEIHQFFAEKGIQLNNDEFENIYSQTAGWPLAINLVSLQVANGYTDVHSCLLYSRSLIFSLIENEIFSSYSREERLFFILTSMLNSFPKDLLMSVGANIKKDIPVLLQNNIFVSYDVHAQTYYFHQIFLDFLREKEHLVNDTQKKDILLKAGDWSKQNGFFIDAIYYYDIIGNKNRIADVIQSFGGIRLPRTDAQMLINYIETFSEEFMKMHIMCSIVYAMLLYNNLEFEKAKSQIKLVQKQLDTKEDTLENQKLRGEALVGEGLIALGTGSLDYIKIFQQASILLPNGSSHWKEKLRLLEYNNALNISNSGKDELDKTAESLLVGMPHISKILHNAGYGLEQLAVAEKHFLRGNFKAAQIHAYNALYMADEKNQIDIANNSLFLLLRISVLTGAVKDTETLLARLEKKAKNTDIRSQKGIDIALSWFYSEMGDARKTFAWNNYDENDNSPPTSIEKDYLLQIRCLIEDEDYAKALALTTKTERIFKKKNAVIPLIYLMLYRTIILYSVEDKKQSADSLLTAYKLSVENKIITPFIEFGHKARPALNHFRENLPENIPAEWLNTIYAKATTYAKRRLHIVSHFNKLENPTLPEHNLTTREIELLRNMSQGLTRNEIAESMYVSPHTVKSMLKNVYNKIGALNSADAVRIASDMQVV